MLSRSLVGLVLCCLVACSGGSGQAGSENSLRACVPGQSKDCAGPSGCQGNQTCTEDGSGYDACACGEPNGTGGTGGSISTGGNSSNANSGGSFVNSGGTVGSIGGSSASIGGSSRTGGNSSVSLGGSTASNGGSTPSTGGNANAGGFTTTGGSKAQTGGKTSTTGGAGTGGKVVVTTGGSATASGGNAPTTGGNPATGVQVPTGGALSTGGSPNTGGSSSTCTDLQPAGSTCASLAANSMCSAAVAAGYCLATCNACGGSGTGGAFGTGGASATGGSTGTGGSSASCSDIPDPNAVYSCAQIAATGNDCSYVTPLGYCLQSCKVCGQGGTGGSSSTGGGTSSTGGAGTGGANGTGGTTSTKLVAKAVSAGSYHACALLTNGTVWCWGANGNYQLGDYSMTTYSSVPVESAVNSTAVAIAAGAYHTCVVLGGNVQCWGDNSHGQTDGGSEILFNTAIAVTAGAYHTCALLSGGNVECWGDNTYGQLGASTTTSSVAQPIPVTGITGATAVSAGGAHTCALFSGGTIQCWGDNSYGQLGISVSVQGSSKPVTVSGIGLTGISTTDATMVSAEIG